MKLIDVLIALAILILVARVIRRPLFSDLKPFGTASSSAGDAEDEGITHDDDDWHTDPLRNAWDDTRFDVDDIYSDPAYSNLPGNIFHHEN